MTHDDLQHTLAPLARQHAPQTRDVTAWIMADVRDLAARPSDDDRTIWRLAALVSATTALAVVVASIAIAPSDNPLAEFAQQTTSAMEVR